MIFDEGKKVCKNSKNYNHRKEIHTKTKIDEKRQRYNKDGD